MLLLLPVDSWSIVVDILDHAALLSTILAILELFLVFERLFSELRLANSCLLRELVVLHAYLIVVLNTFIRPSLFKMF